MAMKLIRDGEKEKDKMGYLEIINWILVFPIIDFVLYILICAGIDNDIAKSNAGGKFSDYFTLNPFNHYAVFIIAVSLLIIAYLLFLGVNFNLEFYQKPTPPTPKQTSFKEPDNAENS